MSRPFEILGLQQIAVGAASMEPMRKMWVDMLGLTPSGHFVSEKENVDEDIVLLGSGPFQVEVDLMQPLDPARSPRVDQPALNHIGLWVDNLLLAVEWLTAQGVRFAPGGIRKGASGHDIAFLHPKANEAFPIAGAGVLIELVQAPPEVIAAYRKGA
jgi:lactoylglutathione lyase